MKMRRLLRWLNRRLNIVSDDPWYDWADQRLDGHVTVSYAEWLEHRRATERAKRRSN